MATLPAVHNRDEYWRDNDPNRSNRIFDPDHPVLESLGVLYTHYLSKPEFRAHYRDLLSGSDKSEKANDFSDILKTILVDNPPKVVIEKRGFDVGTYRRHITNEKNTITLNGYLVEKAVWAKHNLNSAYPYFLFALETTILHQLGHFVVTAAQSSSTPESCRFPELPYILQKWGRHPNPDGFRGLRDHEAGFFVEKEFFGGFVMFERSKMDTADWVMRNVVIVQSDVIAFEIENSHIEAFQDGRIPNLADLPSYGGNPTTTLMRGDQYGEVEGEITVEFDFAD
ncbi:hypothetical protein HK097_010573 [Rhizophlyctis rosea]|uniref:Uncharacterized protein n=1 Tax=Rhizophlyctis rosea TaxID=64517 RepID=A0AAD5SN43_9FUNG|nr:hypothetical protein HK097_010573 [Rhizophlyctis rosea]